jgi:hypothetical protein
MNHLQYEIRSKVNGLRQFSNRDVNIARPGATALIMPQLAAGRLPDDDIPGMNDSCRGRDRVNLLRNLRAISEEFALIRFMQA